jgi:hypothetical protein
VRPNLPGGLERSRAYPTCHRRSCGPRAFAPLCSRRTKSMHGKRNHRGGVPICTGRAYAPVRRFQPFLTAWGGEPSRAQAAEMTPVRREQPKMHWFGAQTRRPYATTEVGPRAQRIAVSGSCNPLRAGYRSRRYVRDVGSSQDPMSLDGLVECKGPLDAGTRRCQGHGFGDEFRAWRRPASDHDDAPARIDYRRGTNAGAQHATGAQTSSSRCDSDVSKFVDISEVLPRTRDRNGPSADRRDRIRSVVSKSLRTFAPP